MDLSFRFDRDIAVMTAIPTELAVLMVGVAVRQAASPTAQLQALLARAAAPEALFAPGHGAFNHAVEKALNGGTDPLSHPATQRQHPMGGRVGEWAGTASEDTLTGWQQQ